MRRVTSIIAVAAMSAMLAACGSGDPTAKLADMPDTKPAEIEVAAYTGDQEVDDAITAYVDMNGFVKVECLKTYTNEETGFQWHAFLCDDVDVFVVEKNGGEVFTSVMDKDAYDAGTNIPEEVNAQ